MRAIASAPGKTILFGEHAVVYSEPAIAGAVDKRATIEIKPAKGDSTILKSFDLGFEAELDTKRRKYSLKKGQPGIIRYILESLYRCHDHSPININLSSDIPIGSGLGSSAAVTVATLAALYRFHNIKFNKKELSREAHNIELKVQGIASPLDTLVSTYGGLVYLSRDKKIEKFKTNFNVPFVVGYTLKYGNTGKMVKGVKSLKENNPEIIDSIISNIGNLTDDAKKAIINEDINKLAELMNINHGLLDSLGVNTFELSRMVYSARNAGATGSKITGAGGGGSIIALCPENIENVINAINKEDNTLKIKFSKRGVSSRVRK